MLTDCGIALAGADSAKPSQQAGGSTVPSAASGGPADQLSANPVNRVMKKRYTAAPLNREGSLIDIKQETSQATKSRPIEARGQSSTRL